MVSIIRSGGKIELSVDKHTSYYIKRNTPIHTKDQIKYTPTIPSPLNAFVARTLNGSLLMDRISSTSGKSCFTISCSGDTELLVLKIDTGKQIAVSFSNIVGFSQQHSFSSYANLSVAAFACDRNFSTIATGPTELIVQTRGNFSVYEEGNIEIDPNQMISWDPKTEFHFSEVDCLSTVYLGKPRMICRVKSGMSPLIIDSVAKNPNDSSGLIKFIKSVYCPRFH